jgi:hypothetical protein
MSGSSNVRLEEYDMNESAASVMDNAIRSSAQDSIGRADVAVAFAEELRSLDASEGAVAAIMGPWGSGKTSFANLVRESLATEPTLPVVDFNPWLFSGNQPLVDVFFKEVSSALRLDNKSKFESIAAALDEYGEILSPIAAVPVVGAWWDRSERSYRAFRKWWAKRGTQPFRARVSEALAVLERPVVVVVDDIDRLSTVEIRDIFRLVRLTANFPNMIYVLAFDRLRVEAALDETNVPGRAYLEKIVQLGFDLPAIPPAVLRSRVLDVLNGILDGVDEFRFAQDIWSDAFFEIVEPFINNLRDVARLALSCRSTIRALAADIEIVDLIALETIRVFLPEVFTRLSSMRSTLTTVSDYHGYGERDDSYQRAQVEDLLKSAGQDAESVRSLIRRVFPAALQYIENNHYGYEWSHVWRRSHRVAHVDYLNLYLERVAPVGVVAFRYSEAAEALLADEDGLCRLFSTVPPEHLEDSIAGLESFAESYPVASVVPAAATLLNLIWSIPRRSPKGMFDNIRRDLTVTRVVLRLFRRLESESDRETAVAAILPRLRSQSSRLELVQFAGHREHVGHKLVSEAFAARIEHEFLEEVRRGRSSVPAEEWNLIRVYWVLKERDGDRFAPLATDDADVVRSIIESSRSVGRSQLLGSRVLQEEEHLWWEALEAVFAGSEAIRRARDTLHAADGNTALVSLIDKYLGGWRPDTL